MIDLHCEVLVKFSSSHTLSSVVPNPIPEPHGDPDPTPASNGDPDQKKHPDLDPMSCIDSNYKNLLRIKSTSSC